MTHSAGLTPLTARQIADVATIDLLSGIVPMIEGSPGIGKSAVARMLAKKHNLCLLASHLSGFEPVDINGFPDLSGAKAEYKPFSNFPTEDDPLPINPDTGKPYAGWAVFLDELTAAKMDTQAAAYPLILDRKVGLRKLHSKVFIIAAGNLDTDNAIHIPFSTALVSRVSRYYMRYDFETFLEDVVIADKWPLVFQAYLEQNPTHGYTFNPEKPELSYASPRTWEFAMKTWLIMERMTDKGILINGKAPLDMSQINPAVLASLEGKLGIDIARSFYNYARTIKDIPTFDEIINAPHQAHLPSSPGLRFYTSVMLRNQVDVQTLPSVYEYMRRYNPEHRVAFLRGLIGKNGIDRTNPTIMQAQQELRQPAVA